MINLSDMKNFINIYNNSFIEKEDTIKKFEMNEYRVGNSICGNINGCDVAIAEYPLARKNPSHIDIRIVLDSNVIIPRIKMSNINITKIRKSRFRCF